MPPANPGRFSFATGKRLQASLCSAVLTGRICDDRGNRMTSSHSNKDGMRYRYYISRVLLQRRKQDEYPQSSEPRRDG
jgi:hypothetical protein